MPWHWVANHIADKLGTRTAADFQIDGDEWFDYQRLYERASSVRRRLIAVHELQCPLKENQYVFTRDVPLLHDREQKRARIDIDDETLGDPSSSISTLLRDSQHIVNKTCKLWKCTTCWSDCDSRTSGLVHWLNGKCIPVKPPEIHPTHVWRHVYPWHFCIKCGAHVSQRVRVS